MFDIIFRHNETIDLFLASKRIVCFLGQVINWYELPLGWLMIGCRFDFQNGRHS